MGSKQAYRDRLADGDLRTDSPAGYVPGGPATGGTEGWYDCDNLRNDSPNNTGLVEFPHTTGTGADAGKVRGNNLWWSAAATRATPTAARSSRVARGAATAAPNYGANPTQGCPYARNDGMTIMNGPVYRYAVRRRQLAPLARSTGTAAGSCTTTAAPSIKHGLLLDPATDQDAGLPIYADSLRDTLSWGGSYMDSKFGPDGALYVQTYDGFFRAGTNVGIYRYDYVGGAPTPGAEPARVPDRRAAASASRAPAPAASRGSGTSVTAQTSTEANPTHTYAEAKRYTATLTVTYADGAKDTKTRRRRRARAARTRRRRSTTAALTPAQPGRRRHLPASRHRHADRDRRGRRQRRGHDRVPRQRRRLDRVRSARSAASSPACT